MVAYSFKKIFVPQIEARTKRQTVRGHRKRHARVGELVQLYYAMRTKHCRKLIVPDPICTRIDEVAILIADEKLGWIDAIEINGIPLCDREIERFAIADGFHQRHHFDPSAPSVTARALMGHFWKYAHGAGAFEGVAVHWNFDERAS